MTSTAEQSLLAQLDAATSIEELAELERQIVAVQQATQVTTEQKGILSRMTPQTAAWLLGRQTRLLRRHQPPRNPDGTYDATELVQWWIEHERRDAVERAATDGATDSAKARLMAANAMQAEMETARMQGSLVDRSMVRDFLGKLSGVMRQAGDKLQREFGREALEILNDAIESAATMIEGEWK